MQWNQPPSSAAESISIQETALPSRSPIDRSVQPHVAKFAPKDRGWPPFTEADCASPTLDQSTSSTGTTTTLCWIDSRYQTGPAHPQTQHHTPTNKFTDLTPSYSLATYQLGAFYYLQLELFLNKHAVTTIITSAQST